MDNHKFYKINLNTEIQFLKGVGPKRGSVLNSFGIDTIQNLIRHFPRKYLDRTNIKHIKDLKIGEQAVIIGHIKSFGLKRLKRGKYFQLNIADETGRLSCIWFNAVSWIIDKFKVNDLVAVFGKIEFYKGLRIIHPEFDLLDQNSDALNTGRIIPIYPSSEKLKQSGLDSRGFRRLVLIALNKLNTIDDHYSDNFLKQESLLSINDAIHKAHSPENHDDLKKAYYRLKFDEYFFMQLALAINKNKIEKYNSKPIMELGPYVKDMYKNLGFELTSAQIRVLKEIRKDLSLNRPMNRLIQGDVGCGKTVVAMLTSAIVIAEKMQVAIMAPTEILAEQHYNSFQEYCKILNISCDLLISNIDAKNKKLIYENLELGNIQIIVGTHALFQKNVKFKNLGLVVVDEQHRFGVEQRKNLISKGTHVNVLAMTATPIPRTLTFAMHGDMDLSWIDEQPKNRIPIKTKIISKDKINIVYDLMKKEMDKGRFCFIVFPIIQESEKIDAKDAESAFNEFSTSIFKDYSLGFLHGKLQKDEKKVLMEKVNNNQIQCLVSTTVVEVGINNPNATIMVIENSERFGLTQLHQLRGRVGRGTFQSYCYLIERKKTLNANKRLKTLEKTLNGFEIADYDLKLRGPGEFFGTKQHGYMSNKLLDIANDSKIIYHARNLAFSLVDKDCNLNEHSKIKSKLINDYSSILEFSNIG